MHPESTMYGDNSDCWPIASVGVKHAHVIASLAGGTGSGMFLDMGYLLTHLMRELEVAGHFLLPEAFQAVDTAGRIYQNTFASLMEIAELKNQRREVEVLFPGGEPPSSPKSTWVFSTAVLKRLDPVVVQAECRAGRLSPNHELRLSLNLLEITRKIEGRGIPVEIQYWSECPPPFYGWIFGEHMLRGEWKPGLRDIWSVQTPMRYTVRAGDQAQFDAVARSFAAPNVDLCFSRELVTSLQTLLDSGINHFTNTFPDDKEPLREDVPVLSLRQTQPNHRPLYRAIGGRE